MAVIKTLDDIIGKNDRYDINKITFFTPVADGSLIIQDFTLFKTYMRFINNYVYTYNVSKDQRNYYRGKPDLLSQDIYDTPELSWLILTLNDKECPSKFRLKSTIRLIPAPSLATVYDTVVTRSTDKLNQNWNTYLTKVVIEDDSE